MPKHRLQFTDLDKSGFTIIELLIASTVFAVILVIITIGIINITQSYTKGLTETKTQNVARNILNDMAQAIQFSPGAISTSTNANPGIIEVSTSNAPADNKFPPTPGKVVYGFCIGEREYVYQLGYEVVSTSINLSSNQAYNGIMVNPASDSCSGFNSSYLPTDYNFINSTTVPTGFTEFLDPNMRISYLMVCQGTLTPTGDCNYVADSNIYSLGVQVSYGDNGLFNNDIATDGSTLCNGSIGTQFCATSKLITVVEKRVI